jgi:thiol-disulfide isomerase/thioredoxin
VVDVEAPFVTVSLDPGGLSSGSGRGEVRFADPATTSGRFAAFTRDLFQRVDAYFEARARTADAGASTTEMRAIYEQYDPVPDARSVSASLTRETEPQLRDLMLVTYMAAPIKTDPSIARASLDEVPPSSSAWTVEPRGLSEALSASGDAERSRRYALSVLATPATGSDSGSGVRSAALGWLLEDALARNATDELAAYHAWLVGEYPDSRAAVRAAALYAPDRRIQPGSPIPAFEVRDMSDPSIAYSVESLSGQVVMMDFWATWCGPCITEMPYLHEAFEEFSDDGFTILSLSFDLSPEDVENFRAEGDWRMPWLHTYVEGGADSELAADLDVVNIPRAILIDRDGTILATNEALRGERLRETLSRVIHDENGGER